MKRIDKIYAYIQERSKAYTRENLQGRIGVDAAEIAKQLNVWRNNVSMELNALHRQDKIVKIIGRPVLYLDKYWLEELCETKLAVGPCKFNAIWIIFGLFAVGIAGYGAGILK